MKGPTGRRILDAVRSLRMTLVVGLVATLLVVGVAAANGTPSALIGVGPQSPAHSVVIADMPDAKEFSGTGLDGALFYAIARHPFDVHAAAKSLDYPTYRLRRILFPMLGGVIAPGGGPALIWALAAISILGTMLGAWWLERFPGAPPWLGLMVIANPGVVLALGLTLCDALATGLVLAAFGAMFKRKVPLAVALLVLACLTRETSFVAALALAAWPGLRVSKRLALLVVPAVPLGLWSVYVARTLGEPLLQQNAGGTFTLPLLGWIRADFGAPEIVVALLGVGLMGAVITRWRKVPVSVTIYVGITLAMVVCSAPIIAETWFGTGRVIAVAMPLSIWALTKRPVRPQRSTRTSSPIATCPGEAIAQ